MTEQYENALEAVYWRFDTFRKKGNSERDAFKMAVRQFFSFDDLSSKLLTCPLCKLPIEPPCEIFIANGTFHKSCHDKRPT